MTGFSRYTLSSALRILRQLDEQIYVSRISTCEQVNVLESRNGKPRGIKFIGKLIDRSIYFIIWLDQLALSKEEERKGEIRNFVWQSVWLQ